MSRWTEILDNAESALVRLRWIVNESPDPYVADAARISISSILELRDEMEKWRNLENEAARYVESVICMRTHFTGYPPYIGWKGLGLALEETLDKYSVVRDENERLQFLLTGKPEE
jgi:hypothetical protein